MIALRLTRESILIAAGVWLAAAHPFGAALVLGFGGLGGHGIGGGAGLIVIVVLMGLRLYMRSRRGGPGGRGPWR